MFPLTLGLMCGLIHTKKRSIKESTQVRYDDIYRRYIEKQIGKYKVADFTPILIERLLQNMADKDFSTKTIRDVYNILNAMFKYAVHNRILTFNPCAGVEIPKTKKKDIGVYQRYGNEKICV